MNILIVDDVPADRLLVRRHVEQLGHQATCVGGAAAAIGCFQPGKFDLVLMDVVMTGASGYNAAHAIREIEDGREWTPIIFLTSLDSDADLQAGIDAGGDDYLTKPVRLGVLSAKIKAMNRLHEMRGALQQTTRALNEANEVLKRLTALDGLTGIANRRRFDDALHAEWLRARRDCSAISLILIDIDHFKQYNDSHGHPAGDECLRRVAQTLLDGVTRAGDVTARYGGEEFAVILPATPLSGALYVAGHLRELVEALDLPNNGARRNGKITISAGLCTAVPNRDMDESVLVSCADEHLYAAKRAGRNRVAGGQLSSPLEYVNELQPMLAPTTVTTVPRPLLAGAA